MLVSVTDKLLIYTSPGSLFDYDGYGRGNSANINSMMPSNALERINEVGGEDDGFLPGKNRRLPAGYFILNKAEVNVLP